MNVSPHHQRPAKYPWPGRASAAMVVAGIAVIVLIGFMVISGGSAPDDVAPEPTAIQELAQAV